MKKIFLLLIFFVISTIAVAKSRAFVYYYDQPKGLYDYFIKTRDNNWEEISVINEKVKFRFITVSEKPGLTILFDTERSIYIRLTDTECFWGKNKDDINTKLYDGVWQSIDNAADITTILELDINIFIYEESGFRGYYRRGEDNLWLEYSYSAGILLNTYTIIEITNEYIIMNCGKCGYFIKLTDDGCYYSLSRSGPYTKRSSGKWTKGSIADGNFTTAKNKAGSTNGKPNSGASADPLTMLKNHVKDSLTKVMKMQNFSNKNITGRKIDKNNLESVAADIAKHFLANMKKDALKKFSSKGIKLSAYEPQKQTYAFIWNANIYNVFVPAAESESFKTNWNKISFTDPDYYFDGKKFMLSYLKMTSPGTKKTYTYDARNQKRTAPSFKIDDLNVTLP